MRALLLLYLTNPFELQNLLNLGSAHRPNPSHAPGRDEDRASLAPSMRFGLMPMCRAAILHSLVPHGGEKTGLCCRPEVDGGFAVHFALVVLDFGTGPFTVTAAEGVAECAPMLPAEGGDVDEGFCH